jgi:hypothetical protein
VNSKSDQGATVAGSLQLGAGFSAGEREHVLDRLSALDPHLHAFRADGTELRLMVKDRGTAQQKVTLEAAIPGSKPLVVTSTEAQVDSALADVRTDMTRLLVEAKERREPNHKR